MSIVIVGLKFASTHIHDCFLSSLISCTEFADQLLIFIHKSSHVSLHFALYDSQTLVLIEKNILCKYLSIHTVLTGTL